MMFHSESQHDSSEPRRHTELSIKCSDSENFDITNFEFSDEKVLIEGHSSSGCPIFQVSSLWSIVEEHYVVCGLVLLAVGFHSLFFGRIALETTIFIAGFFVCLAILGSLLTVFIGPNSKPFVVYLSFILLLFACTLLSYGITRLVDISLFFVGACTFIIISRVGLDFGSSHQFSIREDIPYIFSLVFSWFCGFVCLASGFVDV